MSFNGFENMDLSGVEVKKDILGVGEHVVKITDAKIEAKDRAHQLVLNYENDDGNIRQWIFVSHPSSSDAQRIGLEQIKKLLLVTGHDGKVTPDVAYFKGKTVGIGVKNDTYNGKTKTKVSYHFDPKARDAKGSIPASAGGRPLDDEIPF